MATDARRDSGTQVAIFARAPVPGEVKTRLIPLLGAQDAAELHASLVRRALAVAVRAGVGPVSLWCTPETGHPFFAACAAQYGVALREQRGEMDNDAYLDQLQDLLLQLALVQREIDAARAGE